MSTVSHSKITIRQPKTLKAKIAKAAALRGMTVTSFINGTLEIAAERTLRRIETRELTDRDSAAAKFGFRSLTDDRLPMFLPMATARQESRRVKP
jgi:uncharacterized protein (DUF1778 family)